MSSEKPLSSRERQIMDIVYQLGEVTAARVLEELSDPPGYSAVRTMLRILEDKGHLRHHREGPRYVFTPVENPQRVRERALRRTLNVFFQGSAEQAVSTLLDIADGSLESSDYDRLEQMIRQARREGR